jgi:hypothetical protein
MWSSNSLGLVGAALLIVVAPPHAAHAKRISYDIDGQTYSYDTGDREQIEIARERINAANAVDEIRVRAAAELSANPLVRFFGSELQTELARAEAELKRTLATTVREPNSSRAIGTRVPATNTFAHKALGKRKSASRVDANSAPLPAEADSAAPRQEHPPASARSAEPGPQPKQHVAIARGETPQGPFEQARSAKPVSLQTTASADAEARADLIAQFRAKALAEELRRAELDRKRDRFARFADGQRPELVSPPDSAQVAPRGATRSAEVPASTGSTLGPNPGISDSPKALQPSALPAGSSGPQKLCGITFGLLPGC